MTQTPQQYRLAELKRLLDNLNQIPKESGMKGKALATVIRSYVCGWADRNQTSLDPIIYHALIRGGDPRPEIERSIKLITEPKTETA